MKLGADTSPSDGAPSDGGVSIVRYTVFRLVLFTGLFGLASYLVLVGSWALFTVRNLIHVGGIAYAIFILGLFTIRKYGEAAWYRWTQMAFDTILVTTLVWLSDGPRSPFFVMYFMNILAAAWLLPSWGAVAVAGVDAIAFSFTMVAGIVGWATWDMAYGGVLLYTEWTLRILALFLVGMLAGMLATNLRRTSVVLGATVDAALQLEAEHMMLLDQLDTGILITNDDGTILSSNPAARMVLGEVVGQNVGSVLSPVGDQWEQDYVRHGLLQSLLCRRGRLDIAGGEVVVVEDVTELRQMEQVIKREERLAAVGRLAAGLAHEIRNPLASLSGAVQLLQDESEEELHGIVLREVEHLNELVEDFLDIARPLQLRLAPTDVGMVVTEVAAAFQQDRRYQGRVGIETELSDVEPVLVDGHRLRQVVWNLMLNAAQATPEQGTIRVRVERWRTGIQVEVEDDGVGIPISRMERIFDPFYTTRSGGTGLGLANVDRVVRAHGGEVAVQSTEGQGSCFTLRFPGSTVADGPEEKVTHAS